MDSKSNQKKPNESSPNGSPKKKKRCRVRNRPRNKCNRKLETEISANKEQLIEETSEKQLNIVLNFSGYKESNEIFEMHPTTAPPASNIREMTREEIMAEREAKKLAKQGKKVKPQANQSPSMVENKPSAISSNSKSDATAAPDNAAGTNTTTEISRDQIKAEREAKKQAKHAAKLAKATKEDESIVAVSQRLENFHISGNASSTVPVQTSTTVEANIKKKPALTKAERRALQESQRAAKAQAQEKKTPAKPIAAVVSKQPQQKATTTTNNSLENAKISLPAKSSPVSPKSKECKVKLFNHLESSQKNVNLFVNNAQIHPSIARLGVQYAKRTVVGSNARCIAFLNALKMVRQAVHCKANTESYKLLSMSNQLSTQVIQNFETPPKKEFARSLEAVVKVSVDHLQKCRPLAVSVSNAYKHIKHVLMQLPTDKPESELKEHLCYFIDTYIENQIGKAAQAINAKIQEKINDGDVILTFGCSSLINFICEEAHKRKVDFRVIVVDSRPFCEGQELLRRLTAKEIPCTYVLINAVGFVMPEVTKVLLGAHALLSNGYVMARTGTAQVALVANSFNVPVLVCCETHKFSERFQTDAIVYNELGDPHDLVLSDKCCLTNWQSKNKMSPLNLLYDITPPELVTAVVTEVSVLPCTSVPVILRIKPTEIGYYSY